MIRKKTSGITLFAALATGLSSSCSIVAIGNKANIDKTKDEGGIRSVSSEVKAGSADIAKLLAFGIGSTLTTGAVLVVNDKFNKNSEINTVNQLSSKIKEQENAINRLTQTSRENLSPGEINYENKIRELEEVIAQLTLAAKAKINELEKYKPSGEQTTVKQGTNPLAIVMYVCVSLVMVAILASILFVLYKLKSAGVLETINLIGPLTNLVKKKFKIEDEVDKKGKKEFKLGEFEKNLDLVFEVLNVVKETLEIKEKDDKNKEDDKKFDLKKLKETLEIVKLVGPITELIKKTFEIKEEEDKKIDLTKLGQLLGKIKSLLDNPAQFALGELDKICKKKKLDLDKIIELVNKITDKGPADYAFKELEKLCNEKGINVDNIIKIAKGISSDNPLEYIYSEINKLYKIHSGFGFEDIISDHDIKNFLKGFDEEFGSDHNKDYDIRTNLKLSGVVIPGKSAEEKIKKIKKENFNNLGLDLDGENHVIDVENCVIFVFDKISEKLKKQEESLLKDILETKETKKDMLSKIDKLENKTWAKNELLLDNSEVLNRIVEGKVKKNNPNVIGNNDADRKLKEKVVSKIIKNDILSKEFELKKATMSLNDAINEQKNTDKKSLFGKNKKKDDEDRKQDEVRVKLAREKKEELETKIKELKEQLQLFTDGQENDKDGNKKLREQLKAVDGIIAKKEEKLRNIFLIKLKLKTQKDKIIENVVKKYKSNKNFKSNSERLHFIFNEINNYIKEESGGSLDEIFSVVNVLTKAVNEGEIFNFILKQKMGPEELEKTVMPILQLARDVARILKKQEEGQKNSKVNNINKINEIPKNTSLEIVVTNLTNLLAALERTLHDYRGKDIGVLDSMKFVSKIKDNYNALK